VAHLYGAYVVGTVVGIVGDDMEYTWLEDVQIVCLHMACLGVWYDSTWPIHELPRGTHSLAVWFWQNVWSSPDLNARPSTGRMTW
jgi:hypothetical protein